MIIKYQLLLRSNNEQTLKTMTANLDTLFQLLQS